MGSFFSSERSAKADAEEQELEKLLTSSGDCFPSSEYRPGDRKRWMEGLGARHLLVHQVVWPGTHNSATYRIGDTRRPIIVGPLVPINMVRPFAECQDLFVYDQLCMGCRVLDVRVQKDCYVRHGPVVGYSTVDVVLDDVNRFLAETTSEVIILEVRTEHGQEDPPEFAQYLVNKLHRHLISQDEEVFEKTIAELLPKGRVICVWKPSQSPAPNTWDLRLWNGQYLRDDWIDTDMPKKKFDHNLRKLKGQLPVSQRRYFYRVENTATAAGDNWASLTVRTVTGRIHKFARLFMSTVFFAGDDCQNKLQVFSTDFINEDFVDACVAFTKARIDGDCDVIHLLPIRVEGLDRE